MTKEEILIEDSNIAEMLTFYEKIKLCINIYIVNSWL